MKITLPYPPSVNCYWRHIALGKRAVTLLSRDGREYKKKVAGICLAEKLTPLVGPVVMHIEVYRPRRIGDLDGILKALLDSLQGFAYANDSQVTAIFARRWDDKTNPRVEVVLFEDSIVG